MPYTVDPNDNTTPLDGQDAEQGAEEFRALKNQLNGIPTSGTLVAAASGSYGSLLDLTTLTPHKIYEYWISIPGDQFFNYGQHGVVYQDGSGPVIGKIITGGLSDVRITGNFLEAMQASGIPSDIKWRIYGSKGRLAI